MIIESFGAALCIQSMYSAKCLSTLEVPSHPSINREVKALDTQESHFTSIFLFLLQPQTPCFVTGHSSLPYQNVVVFGADPQLTVLGQPLVKGGYDYLLDHLPSLAGCILGVRVSVTNAYQEITKRNEVLALGSATRIEPVPLLRLPGHEHTQGLVVSSQR
jgi:hypothetical protein